MLSLAIKMCVCVNKIWIDLEKARNSDKNDQTNMKTFHFFIQVAKHKPAVMIIYFHWNENNNYIIFIL